MTGFGGSPVIWEPTKNYLKGELGKHTSGTTIHIIPFQEHVLPAISFRAEEYNNRKWNDIEEQIDKYVKKITGTNICDAWSATDRYIDLHKDNYIILLTDGKDTKNGMTAVAKKLSDWCGKYPNSYAFYVQLTEAAIDKGVEKVINICDNEFMVDASKRIPVFGGFDKGLIIYANTLNLDKTHRIGFSSSGLYKAKAISKDPYFDVKMVNNKIDKGIVPIKIVARKPIAQINSQLLQIYHFTFDIVSDEVTIINPSVKVQMTNKPERGLEILSDGTDMGKATWYDKFLFWSAKTPDTLSVDLNAIFNDEANKDGSAVKLQINDQDKRKDYQLFFRKQLVKDGVIILCSRDKDKSILSIVFNPNAEQGKRYLEIRQVTSQELDNINDHPVKQYLLQLRSDYEVKWNPLKTILMWLGILILAALVLWFAMIKRIIYPSISIRSIQINDPYYCRLNVKGKRRVVFTDKAVRQSLLSRIFTGEILYKIHDIWTSPLALEAGGRRKTLRVMRTKDYVFDPYTSLLKAPGDYTVEKISDNTKIKITIN